MDIPKRQTLRSQTADLIRRQLRDGLWVGPLPAEQTFADQFQVSRVTVRLALAELKREGLVEMVRHRYRPVAATGSPVKRSRGLAHAPPIRVGYLCPLPMGEVMLRKLREIYNLQRLLQDLSIQLILITDPQLGRQRNPDLRLKRLMSETRAACWVLGLCPAPIQRWFAGQRLPAIISGSSHEGVPLPSFDWDHRAIGRHAAGLLHSRGHRRIALLTPERLFAGDLESEAGFFEVSARLGPADPPPVVLRHDGTPEMIRRLIHTVFAREPHPTALASIHAPDAMTVLTCLQADGFRVPGDIAVLSLQGDPSLAHLIPAIAHYEWRSDLLVKRLMRAILEATTGTATPESTLIMSRFYPGESLGPMPPPRP